MTGCDSALWLGPDQVCPCVCALRGSVSCPGLFLCRLVCIDSWDLWSLSGTACWLHLCVTSLCHMVRHGLLRTCAVPLYPSACVHSYLLSAAWDCSGLFVRVSHFLALCACVCVCVLPACTCVLTAVCPPPWPPRSALQPGSLWWSCWERRVQKD